MRPTEDASCRPSGSGAELNYSYEPYSRHPYYGFRLSTSDLARFGLLFLRNGRWGGQQVVPADWVRESTPPHSVIGPQGGYGYMWWTGEGEGAFASVDEGPGCCLVFGSEGRMECKNGSSAKRQADRN